MAKHQNAMEENKHDLLLKNYLYTLRMVALLEIEIKMGAEGFIAACF